MMYNSNSSSIIGRLSKVINKSDIKPIYKKDQTIKFESFSEFFFGFELRVVTSKWEFKAGKKKQTIQRRDLQSFSDLNLNNSKLYFYEDSAENIKDKFLLSDEDHNVYQIRVSPNLERVIETSIDLRVKDKDVYTQKIIDRVNKIKSYLLESNLCVDYAKVEIPDSFTTTTEEEDKEFDAVVAEEELTPAGRRKLEEKIVYSYFDYTPYRTDANKKYTYATEEIRLDHLSKYTGKIYYGTTEDENKLTLATMIAFKYHSSISSDYRIIKIAKNNVKHFKKFDHIDKFFMEITADDVLEIDNKFISWNTARLISNSWKDFTFLENFSIFNSEMCDLYKELYVYCDKYDVNLTSYRNKNIFPFQDESFTTDFDYLLNKITDLQIFLEGNKDPESLIVELDKIEGLPNTIKGIKAVDMDIYLKLQTLINYVSPIKDLLNEIPLLTKEKSQITVEVESLIRDFLNSKNVKMC